ncbi:MAG TPA: SCO family protein [Myxococcota bacterium]|nr:SCO family protein [Myxococcota bacterium]
MSTPIGPQAEQSRRIRWALRIAGAAVVVLGLWFVSEVRRSLPPQAPEVGPAATVLPVPKPLPTFTLTDDAGEPFTRERLEGHWSFLFFGYASCPSICPITMATLRDLRHELVTGSPPLDDAQVVLVSIDPDRDDPATLHHYVHYFDPTFVGATGEPAEIDRLTRALGVFHQRTPGGSDDDYDFDHSASVLLVDPDASLHAVFSPPIDPAAAAEAFRAIRKARR